MFERIENMSAFHKAYGLNDEEAAIFNNLVGIYMNEDKVNCLGHVAFMNIRQVVISPDNIKQLAFMKNRDRLAVAIYHLLDWSNFTGDYSLISGFLPSYFLMHCGQSKVIGYPANLPESAPWHLEKLDRKETLSFQFARIHQDHQVPGALAFIDGDRLDSSILKEFSFDVPVKKETPIASYRFLDQPELFFVKETKTLYGESKCFPEVEVLVSVKSPKDMIGERYSTGIPEGQSVYSDEASAIYLLNNQKRDEYLEAVRAGNNTSNIIARIEHTDDFVKIKLSGEMPVYCYQNASGEMVEVLSDSYEIDEYVTIKDARRTIVSSLVLTDFRPVKTLRA